MNIRYALISIFFVSVSATANTPANFQELVEYWQAHEVKSSSQALEVLPPELASQYVDLHTSRSLHRASEDFPRRIFIPNKSPQDKSTSFFLAASARPLKDPVLEVIDYDFKNMRVDFYAMTWEHDERLRIAKNPPVCFSCHGAGRALWPGLSRDHYWPGAFTGPQYDEPNERIEKVLSAFNAEIQAQAILSHPQFPKYRKALLTSLQGDTQGLKSLLPRRFWKAESPKVFEFVTEAHNMLQHFMGWRQNHPHQQPNRRGAHIASHLALTLHAMGQPELIEPLSLNLRPQNFELSETTLSTLQNLIKESSPPDPLRSDLLSKCRRLLGFR